ncbi:MAG TPA: hypothetical protein ENJ52_12370 [Aliiroseovarius sp.]|nr:hypothetical protein [Aliiroseovarius sp.]
MSVIPQNARRKRPITTVLRGFFHREDASLSVEAVIVLPFMLWAFAALFSFTDIYRARALAIKGNYAIADLLSRETQPIDMTYLNGVADVFSYITESGDDSWIRVTPVRCKKRCSNPNTRVLRRDWSRATDGVHRLTNSEINEYYRDIVPLIAKGERVIMVETQVNFEPPIRPTVTGVTAQALVDTTFTRPRFGPQLCWGNMRCLNDY